jgi:hypothetical protein
MKEATREMPPVSANKATPPRTPTASSKKPQPKAD